MKKNDIQRVSDDQHIEGHEDVPLLVRTSGTCRRLETDLMVEMSFDTGKEVEIFYINVFNKFTLMNKCKSFSLFST